MMMADRTLFAAGGAAEEDQMISSVADQLITICFQGNDRYLKRETLREDVQKELNRFRNSILSVRDECICLQSIFFGIGHVLLPEVEALLQAIGSDAHVAHQEEKEEFLSDLSSEYEPLTPQIRMPRGAFATWMKRRLHTLEPWQREMKREYLRRNYKRRCERERIIAAALAACGKK
jgi:hypothetical protein